MNENSGIYVIKVGRHFYYGRSVNLHKREKEHLRTLKKGKHHNIVLQRAYNKYKDFSFRVIGVGRKEDLECFEQLFIDNTRNCNISDSSHGAASGNLNHNYGKRHTEEFKRYLSSLNKGKLNSSYDDTQRVFIRDEEKFVGTQYEFRETFGLCKKGVSKLVRGKLKTYKGWRLS